MSRSGVIVKVKPAPPPRPARPPAEERPPRVVLRPPEPAAPERDMLLRRLVSEHGAWIHARLRRLLGTTIPEESAKDLGQRVLLVLDEHLRSEGPPAHLRGYLAGVIRNLVSNHRRLRRLELAPESGADEAIWSAPDPEEALEILQRWAKFERYLGSLPVEEAQVIQCVDLDGLSVTEAAVLLDRPRGTVSSQLTRGRDKLEQLALASEQAAELRAPQPRKPTGARHGPP